MRWPGYFAAGLAVGAVVALMRIASVDAAGIAAPVLLLSEPPHDSMAEVVERRLTPTLYTQAGVEAAAKAVAAAAAAGRHAGPPLAVHVKVDTGMHRVGAPPEGAVEVALAVSERPELRLEGLWTHFAVADDPADPFTAEQLEAFRAVAGRLQASGLRPSLLHTCNSAGVMVHPGAAHDLVRCGIALYGVAPSADLQGRLDLRPAMSLRARVTLVKEVAAGEALSYGLRYRLDRPSVVATVPVGYADGVPWRLGTETGAGAGAGGRGGEVLIGGRRRPIAGSVTMDQILVDCGDDHTVSAGDEVVLLGEQGGERIGAWDWAQRIGTIGYEVLTSLGRRYHRMHLAAPAAA
jgi:alanine racemase